MHYRHIIFLLIFLPVTTVVPEKCFSRPELQTSGSVSGSVVNAETKEAIAGVNIILLGTSLGTSADSAGRFTISNVPVGSYSLAFQSIGYAYSVVSDVIVRSGRITFVDAGLREEPVHAAEVAVEAEYFQKNDVAPISSISFNYEEVRRAPGSAGDVSRVLMALPSVGQINHNANDLVVRGGSPAENSFFVDGIQIPNINHFPVIGASGGPIGLINVDFLQDVTFYTGGFPSSFGDRLSSVIDMKFRDGNRDTTEAQLDVSMQGAGGIIEGPLPKKAGSWFFSARRSYLDLILKIMNEDAIPRYGDMHGKVTVNLDSRNRIEVLDIFGSGSSEISLESALRNGEESFGTTGYDENTVGVRWRSLRGDRGYSLTSLSYSFISSTDRWNEPVTGNPKYSRDDFEGWVRFRNSNYLHFNDTFKLEAGIDAEVAPSRFSDTYFSSVDRIGNISLSVSENRKLTNSLLAGFISVIWMPVDRVTCTVGFRGDYYSINRHIHLSPRLSLSWQINERLSLNGSAGIFVQSLPAVLLVQSSNAASLGDPMAAHIIVGADYMVTADAKFTVEVYSKTYRYLPLTPDDPSLSIIDEGRSGYSFKHYSALAGIGEAYARGIELLLQKKLAQDFYGLAGVSLFRSRYRGCDGVWRDRAYDNRFLFCLIGGYKPNNDWEFSVRWNIAGGTPYTPFDLDQSTAARTGIIDKNRINGERYPDYHSLSLRADKRFNFRSSCITLYIQTLNTYNRENIIRYYWDAVHNRQKADTQWSFIPVFGFEYEF